MTPEYLDELADIADPDKLWTLFWEDQRKLPPEKKHQLDTGVALRRHASHLRELQRALDAKRSVCITPLGSNHTAHMLIDTPADHEKLRAPQPYGDRA